LDAGKEFDPRIDLDDDVVGQARRKVRERTVVPDVAFGMGDPGNEREEGGKDPLDRYHDDEDSAIAAGQASARGSG